MVLVLKGSWNPRVLSGLRPTHTKPPSMEVFSLTIISQLKNHPLWVPQLS